MVRPSFPSLAQMFTGPVLYNTTSNEESYDDFTDAELTREILNAAKEKNIPIPEELNIQAIVSWSRDVSEGRTIHK